MFICISFWGVLKYIFVIFIFVKKINKLKIKEIIKKINLKRFKFMYIFFIVCWYIYVYVCIYVSFIK